MRASVPNTGRNDWIQVLRAVAALAVLCFHMQPQWNTSAALTPYMRWASHGFAGVDIFFVLSGFVVYLSARRSLMDAAGLLRFFRRRALRIYLGYWPVFILMVVVAAVMNRVLPAFDMRLLRSALLLQPDIWQNIVPTAWSLSLELWFYLWLGLVVFWARPQAVKAISWWWC